MDVLPRNILFFLNKVQILNSLSEWSWLETHFCHSRKIVKSEFGRYHVSQAAGQFPRCSTKLETSHYYTQILSSGLNVQPYTDYQMWMPYFCLFCDTHYCPNTFFALVMSLWNTIVGKHMVDLYKSLKHPKHWRPTRGKHRTLNKNTTTV